MLSRGTARSLLNILVVALCTILVVWISIERFEQSVGIDFYHYWGIQAAMADGDLRGKNPWEFGEIYLSTLGRIVSGTDDERLRDAAAFRPDLHVTGTPLQYAFFDLLPADYSRAFAIYQTAQILCFALAVGILFRLLWPQPALAAALIAAAVALYLPLVSELMVGNLNSIQALAVTALAALLYRRSTRRSAWFGAAFLSSLVALVLFKPSIAIVCLALACSLWYRERPPLLRSVVSASVAGALLVVFPCLYFGSWTVWVDWVSFVRDPEKGDLFFPTAWGNYSTVVLLMEEMRIGYAGAMAVVGALFAGGALLGVALKGRGNPFKEMLEDPFRICALGIVTTAAISPVYWPHYYLFCLFAALYLLLPPRKPWLAAALALLSILLSSGWVPAAAPDSADLPWRAQYSAAASWLLLVPILFMTVTPTRE
jgi:hypothetical protein